MPRLQAADKTNHRSANEFVTLTNRQPIYPRMKAGGVHAVGQHGNPLRRRAQRQYVFPHGRRHGEDMVGTAHCLPLRCIRQGFQTQPSETFLFFSERRIHFEHKGDVQGGRDMPAGPMKKRITFVEQIGLHTGLIQRAQDARGQLAVACELAELAVQRLIPLLILDSQPRSFHRRLVGAFIGRQFYQPHRRARIAGSLFGAQ